MGNIIGRKAKVVTEELETLSQNKKKFMVDLEHTYESKRMMLWYLTMSAFFLSTSLIGYVWLHFDRREYQVLLSLLSFTGGVLIMWVGRRLVNSYYDWKVAKKKKAIDALIDRKKEILKTVKKTETYEVAEKILKEYEDEINEKPSPTQNAPVVKSSGQEGEISSDNVPNNGFMHPQRPGGPPQRPAGPPPHMNPGGMRPPVHNQGSPIVGSRLMNRGPMPIGPGPIRPFQKEGKTTVDKMVDYFFGDGPKNRMALICKQCSGHNGMAMVDEFDYLPFVCFICGFFNPANKLRPPRLNSAFPPSTSTLPENSEIKREPWKTEETSTPETEANVPADSTDEGEFENVSLPEDKS